MFGSIIGLIAFEFFMQGLIFYTNLPVNLDPQVESRTNEEKYNYNRDITYEIYSKNSSHTIVFIGDSFTNGGNVNFEQSFPYQSFLRFNKKIEVRNMGVCEDTTFGASKRLTIF